MGRRSTIESLELEEIELVNEVIRNHRYGPIDQILEAVRGHGLAQIKRSALHRYIVSLKERDDAHRGSPDDVIVVVIERSTGATTSVTTSASKALVLSAIEKLKPRDPSLLQK